MADAESYLVWFNPDCSKCRAVRERLEQARVPYVLRDYQASPPTRSELEGAIAEARVDARALLRSKDPLVEELGLDGGGDDGAILDALVAHPRLIERPIVFHGGRAVIARPPERVAELLG